jgi:succinate dehydrogenase/fumarate reductase flavoprotein subunit
MGGNALTEILVFGARAGRYAAENAEGIDWIRNRPARLEDERERLNGFFRPQGVPAKTITDKLAAIMSEYVGVPRTETGLLKALSLLDDLKTRDLPELKAPPGRRFNLGWIEAIQVPCMLDVAEMIIRSALYRTESRGAHYREDYPESQREWIRHVRVRKSPETMSLGTTPVVITRLLPEEAE